MYLESEKKSLIGLVNSFNGTGIFENTLELSGPHVVRM